MAERLFISESDAVRTHLRNINLKLHAANRARKRRSSHAASA